MLKKSRNLFYYLIVESNYDTSKRQVNVIAEVAVRANSLRIDLSKSYTSNSKLLEKEIREHLENNSRFTHHSSVDYYSAYSYQ